MSLPTLRLTTAEFEALPEYSLSLPTGTREGKRWRCNNAWGTKGPKRWVIGEYVYRDGYALAKWYTPELIDAPPPTPGPSRPTWRPEED